MLNRQEKRFMVISSIISIVLAVAIFIPWSAKEILPLEAILKVWVMPIIALILFVFNLTAKYRNYRPSVRFTTVASYLPIFSTLIALFGNLLLVLMRSSLPYSETGYLAMVMFTTFFLVALVLVTMTIHRIVLIFSKNEMMLIDAPMVLLYFGCIFFVNTVFNKYMDASAPFMSTSIFFVIVPAVV